MNYIRENEQEDEQEDKENIRGELSRKEKSMILKNKIAKKRIGLLISFILLVICGLLMITYINRLGSYPWGSDIYGHLFKGNILFDAINNGDLYLNYEPGWYNGLQPYRYWGPLPYYILAGLNFITHNIYTTYNLFILLVFIVGGSGFLLWGYWKDRQALGFIFGVLWFCIPNNLDVIFSQGNVPFIVVNTLIPFLFYFYYRGLEEEKIKYYIIVSVFMAFITLNHAMLTAMLGITLFIFTLIYSIYNKKYGTGFIILTYAFLGIMISAFWLLPALKGGIIGQGKDIVGESMEFWTSTLSDSINPLKRFGFKESYYFGLAYAIVGFMGMIFAKKKERAGFFIPVLVLLGTTTVAYKILSKLPMSQVFWMTRFTGLSMCILLFSFILWKTLRKKLVYIFVVLMIMDSAVSFKIFGYNSEFKQTLANSINVANSVANQRVAMLDSSTTGSFPSLYLSYDNKEESHDQVYGWAWQGATTGSNIVMLNEALEKGYYALMFDRALELGADSLIVHRNLVKDNDEDELAKWASQLGYIEIARDNENIVYNYPVDSKFGTVVKYDGISIGKYASNICALFPSFTVGESQNLDDYTLEELMEYDTIYLSGFKYKDKQYCEELVDQLDEQGKKVIIDVTGMDSDGFRGIYTSSIKLNDNYGEFYYNGELKTMTDFPEEISDFRAYALSGMEESNMENSCLLKNRVLNYLYEETENITFIGLNIPYYAQMTKDETALRIMEDVFEKELYDLPDREVIPIDIKYFGDERIEIKSEEDNVLVPIAAIDAFEAEKGKFTSFNNLVLMDGNELDLTIGYPYVKPGIVVSIIAIIAIISLSILIKTGKLDKLIKRKEVSNNDR